MKRALKVTTLLAMGFLGAASVSRAQDVPAATGSSGGEVSVGALGRDDVGSSKFSEYRDIPKSGSMPFFRLFSKGDWGDFNLYGYNVRQDDQRYNGWLKTSAFDVSFDFNQIPHNMGNDGRTILSQLSPGVWGLSNTLQQSLGSAVEATPTAGRTVAFYDALLNPTFASAGLVDISSTRKRGTVAVELGKKLPFDLTLTYMRELKSGYRGDEGGGVYSAVQSVIEVPSPLNEITQDFGVRAARNFKKGNVHASFTRNVYNNRAETLTIDNPFQALDTPYVTTPATVGGGSAARWILAPDNQASTGNAGFQLKFARQTRISGDVSLSRWTQNAPFYPYTINSAIMTPAGLPASDLSALQQPSLNGRIETSTVNLMFSSRPAENLTVRAQFRRYDLSNKTDRFIITGDVAASPDRTWSVVTPSADAPFGHATANVYDNTTTRFTASASYDFGPLTLEAQGRTAKLERTSREATSGKDNGFAVTALLHARDWLGFRGTWDQARRTAEGQTYYGFQSDEAERRTKRAGIDVELTPHKNLGLTFAYFRRDVEYPNRPDRIAMSAGEPMAGAAPIPGTPSGLLLAKYDSFTTELTFTPTERAELGAYYTYEKDRTTNQWATTTGVNLNNLLNYAGRDKTDTFGLNGVFQLKPEVWKLSVNAMRQKVDGLMDITARELGSFYTPGRTTLVPAGTGGAEDIPAWDDTLLTTVSAQLDYAAAKAWTLSAGYIYEKYDFKDAYTAGDLLMPQSVLIFLKPNRGGYNANVFFARASYQF
jgi:hypothetical protein